MTTTKERLEAAVVGLETFSDECDAKGAAFGAEDLAELTKRMTEIKDLKAQVETEAEAKGAMAEAQAFLKSLGSRNADDADDPKVQAFTVDGLPMNPRGKTFGELFVESAGYGDFVKAYAKNGVIPNAAKGIQSSAIDIDSKALLTGGSATSAGAFVRNDLYSPLTDLVGERELTIRDLVTIGSTDSDAVDYVRVTSKTNAAATVAEATSAAAPTQDGSTGPLVLDEDGGYKPESSIAFESVSTAVKTIAHWIPMTKRAAADAGQVRTLVDAFLRYGLNEELEDQILKGDGTGENFTGILNSSPMTVGSAGTDLDAIVDAIRAVRVTGRNRPTGLVVHPNDWYSAGFLLAKDSSGNYLVGDPRASVDQLNQLWGLQVVVSEAMTENTALVGDFRKAVLWEREGVSVMVSDQHADFFTRNLLAILAEMRAAFGVLDPQAFCTVTSV
jgi:HK97 family phage major capsid protein